MRPNSIVAFVALAVLLAANGIACSGGASANGVCSDDLAPETDTVTTEALKVSRLRLESRSSYDADGVPTASTVVTLALADLSLVSVESRPPTPCCGSLSCFLLTGAPVRRCRDTDSSSCGAATCDSASETCVDNRCVPCTDRPLDARSAKVSGLTGGPVDLDRAQSIGSWLKAGLPAPLFTDDDVEIRLDGSDQPDFFPSYSETIAAPDPLEIVSPDPSQPLTATTSDLVLEWRRGNGDWIEAQVRSTAMGANDSVVCVTRDDGCMTIPAGAFDTIRLDMKPDDQIKLSVLRVVSRSSSIGDDSVVAQTKGVRRVDMIMPQ